MNPVARTVPTNLPDTRPAAGESGLDRAWQREMEKAQTQRWFHGASPARSAPADTQRVANDLTDTSASTDALRTAAGAQSGTGSAAAAIPSALLASLPNANAVRSAAALFPATAPQRAPMPTTAPNTVRPVARVAASELAERVDAAQAPANEATDASTPDVRVHVEETPLGLRVWFGIAGEGPAVAARAQALLAELRRDCGAAGQRLALVVCNGETLFDAASPHSPVPHLHQEP